MPANPPIGAAARRLAPAGVALALALAAAGAHAAVVEVAVTGVTDARGHVHVDLCTSQTFLKGDCPYQGSAPATPGATVIKIAGVAPGQYAAQVFQDENDDGAVGRNGLGIPTEAIGFSNDAPLHIRGPRFSDAAFEVERGMARITLKLRRLLGPAR